MSSATISDAGFMDPDVKAYLKRHLRGTVTRNYPVVRFIRDVCDFEMEHLEVNGDTRLNLSKELCEEYLLATYSKHPPKNPRKDVRGEGRAAVAFEKIWNHLASQLPTRDDRKPMVFLNMKDRTVRGTYAKYKPDFTYSPFFGVQDQRWEYMFGCGELKKEWWDALKFSAYKYSLEINPHAVGLLFLQARRGMLNLLFLDHNSDE